MAQDGGQPDETLQKLTQFANVETAVLSPAPAAEGSAIIELTFRDRGSIYRDLALIRDALALPADAVQAHSTLLALYLVTDPQDPSPPLLLPFLLAVLGAAAAALVLLIRSSFENHHAGTAATSSASWPASAQRPARSAPACCRRPPPCRWRRWPRARRWAWPPAGPCWPP